jgi:hypothetical protein
LNIIYNYKIIIEKFGMKVPVSLNLSYQVLLIRDGKEKRRVLGNLLQSTQSQIYCGVMKFLADMPSCLGGGDNRINIA